MVVAERLGLLWGPFILLPRTGFMTAATPASGGGCVPPREDNYRALVAWQTFLQRRLEFPFFAVVDVGPPYGPVRPETRVAVSDLNTVVDDTYGVLAELGGGPNGQVHPLCDLRVDDGKSRNFQPVHDYCVWFANR
jgi:hypothetical protein